jgi:hypothetical protein
MMSELIHGNATIGTLNGLMQFDHVIQVRPDGTIDECPQSIWAPEVYCETADDEYRSVLNEHEQAMIASVRSQGWELETGWTDQWGYNGALMHPSEFVGGRLEDHIRETPGYWVACLVCFPDAEDYSDGWVIAFCEIEEESRG